MSKRCVLIMAPEGDIHVAGVADALARRGVAVECIDLASLTRDLSLTLSLDDAGAARIITPKGQVVDLTEVLSIWWRRPRLPDEDSELDTVSRTFVRGEWTHFVEGIEAFTPPLWVNSPAASRLAELKAFQLVSAREEGLRVPRTRITNDPEAVKEFARNEASLIYKRIGPAPLPLTATKPLLPSDLDRLHDLRNCPTLFQERIDAQCDIRVTAMGQDLYATEIDSQNGASPWDWRFDHTVRFRDHTLDTETATRLHALMRRLGLRYGAIDLRLTSEGEYVFLEVNPSGQYLFIELLTGAPLSERMAALLAGQEDIQDGTSAAGSAVSRPHRKWMEDTSAEATSIAKGTLLELYARFPQLREGSVVAGGIAVCEWVGRVSDIGAHNTRDIDLILDPKVGDSHPQTRTSMLESNFYEHRTLAGLIVPYSFLRKGSTPRDGVSIDFEGPECAPDRGVGQLPGLREIGDLQVKATAEGDLALRHSVTKRIQGLLPDGSSIEGAVRLVPPFVLIPIKATAFAERGMDSVAAAFRRNHKDAADLYALLRFSLEGPTELANLIRPYRSLPLIKSTVRSLVNYFFATDGQGVDAVIQFVQPGVGEADLRRKVVEVATEYVRALDR